ncbi:hypothetical protein TcasGA2_TC033087 [Tribolium castaneum]|uniref:Uncharacterized protein n=1 Tax=Tribolium castaneum TaxID=7070 RepID=A0A139WIR9_TRICA|nr:hypothetical protein TcasGA2_TC033087 [Tribolium castaneum]
MRHFLILSLLFVLAVVVAPYCLPNCGLMPFQYVPLKAKLKAKLCAKFCGAMTPAQTIWWA